MVIFISLFFVTSDSIKIFGISQIGNITLMILNLKYYVEYLSVNLVLVHMIYSCSYLLKRSIHQSENEHFQIETNFGKNLYS